MNKRQTLWLPWLMFTAGVLAWPAGALAQVKASSAAIDWLKSIGITKPALARAPDFTLRDVGGGTVSLASYRGSLLLLNFWATWCGPCRDEMPSMETLSRNFGGQGLSLVAINQKEGTAQVANFMKTHGLNFPTPLDSDGRVSAAYRVFGIPVTYVVDGSGNAIGMASGARDWAAQDVVEVFRKLVTATGSAPAGSSMALEPNTPLPNALRAKGGALILRAQQDPLSEAVAKLPSTEEVMPLGKVFGAGEFWYMVRVKNGTVGWARGVEVDEIRRAK